MSGTLYVVFVIAVLVFIVLAKTARVVPQQSGYVIENLGRYSRTIQAGFHILIPFVERIAYRPNLKEEAVDIVEQVCITKKHVQGGWAGSPSCRYLKPARRPTESRIIALRSRSSRRRRCAARSARSSSTAPS